MKHNLIISIVSLGVFAGVPALAHDLPPSETSPYEHFSPHEHAELYLNLVSHLYYALIPLQDSVVDEASAAAARDKILALHRRLNMAIDHMSGNPDMRNEVLSILRNNPARLERMRREQNLYNISAERCRATGLIPDMPTIRRVTIPTED
jgi:hypothetical protein